jgi:uncharacterized protein YuzE
MKADYDSEANALSIDLIQVEHWEDGDSVDKDGQCNVAFSQGRVVNVELLHPSKNLELLHAAAERFDLDAEGLLAAARAALAAPDRSVTLELTGRLAGST